MSLIETNLSDVVKKQFSFKVKAYWGVFNSLAIMQLIAVLFSLAPSFNVGYGSASFSVNISFYSADIVIVFTMLWAFISAILITTKATRYDDFAFVGNRVSSNISNALFLSIASVIGGITAILSSYFIKVIVHFIGGIQSAGSITIQELLIGIAATILYVFLFSAIGYLVGICIQISKLFIIILPALLIGTIVTGVQVGKDQWLVAVFNFFAAESSFLLFFIKVIVVAGILFSGSATLSNRMEVRN